LEVAGFFLFVVPEADVVAGWGEGVPGDVEPAGTGEELVGHIVSLEEGHEALELLRVLGADVGGLAKEVLRVADTTYQGVNARVAEAGVDDDGANDAAGRLQQMLASVGHVGNLLDGRDIGALL
jgi:hypothetical protein